MSVDTRFIVEQFRYVLFVVGRVELNKNTHTHYNTLCKVWVNKKNMAFVSMTSYVGPQGKRARDLSSKDIGRKYSKWLWQPIKILR